MSDTLEQVAAAQQARTDAEAAFTAAVRAARADGATLQRIADACGLTRAGVLKVIQRAELVT